MRAIARHLLWGLVIFTGLLAECHLVTACPFCVAAKPTLMQQCDSAEVAVLAECVKLPTADSSKQFEFQVRHVIQDRGVLKSRSTIPVRTDVPVKEGTLALLVGTADAALPQDQLATLVDITWECLPVNEVGFAYLARAPDLRKPTHERLPYYAAFLEHADPLVAEDAYFEFAHAPYEAVAEAAEALPSEKLRKWIVDPGAVSLRRGFYGLALGLTAKGQDREPNLNVLKKLVRAETEAGGDFRSGFDGVLGGYLVAAGPDAVEEIRSRFLADPKAAIGDVRHAHRALRFFHDVAPAAERPAIATAVEHLLNRPSEAPLAIADLARWKHWSALEKVAGLYPIGDREGAPMRRAVVGYLQACPLPAAQSHLARLRQADPQGFLAAEKSLQALPADK
jgi:hypothetical protein